jgi:CPA1 family monovalent cation:H+ antiporter
VHDHVLVLLGVLVAVGLLLLLAYKTRIPYPIVLVAGSVGLGFIPGTPDVEVDPDTILIGVLPPLLYAAAFFSNLHEMKDNLRPIGLLAIGLVLFTTVAVGVVGHEVIGLSWPVAFTLGAIVSPTDAVSATAIAGRLGAPRRYVTIVEGESLVNDATALIAYKFAVAAVVTGTFSLAHAVGAFLVEAGAGIAIGLAVGWIVQQVRQRIRDAPTEIAITLITPYLAYLPSEALGVSAVLSAVTCGIYLGWQAPRILDPATRLQSFAVWETVVFLLNSFLFVLVGLELPTVLDDIGGEPAGSLLRDGLLVAATVVAVRFIWVFPAMLVPERWSDRVSMRDPRSPVRSVVLIGWTGMRGALSLAAALAIPTTIDAGGAFPDRNLVIFLVYCVILVTLVGQGLALPWFIRWAGVSDEEEDARMEAKARRRAAEAAIARIDELLDEDWVHPKAARRLRSAYEYRLRRFDAQLDEDDDGEIEEKSLAMQRLRREVLEAERAEILALRDAGEIPDDTMRDIERDLDLDDTRLDI